MAYTAKDYAKLIGMPGFSETLLKNHFTLYQGYVTNTNKVLDTLAAMAKDGKTATPEYAELKRRLGWEFNGMRLHEYLLREPRRQGPARPGRQARTQDRRAVRDVEAWEKDFRATGAMRGIGWAVLYQDIVQRPADQLLDQRARRQPPGRLRAAPHHGRLRARLHDRLRPEAGRLHRGLLQEHRLGGRRLPAQIKARQDAGWALSGQILWKIAADRSILRGTSARRPA